MRRFIAPLACAALLVGSGCDNASTNSGQTSDTTAETSAAQPADEAPASSVPSNDPPTAAPSAPEKTWRGLLGPDNAKIQRTNGTTRVWAGGGKPGTDEADYFDFTGAPLDPTKLQFGIGKDRIPSIDDPLFVPPDDPRLMQWRVSRYRPEETAETVDDIMVIGYAIGDDVRAYPTALLDRHELVNDTVGGKPVTVGW